MTTTTQSTFDAAGFENFQQERNEPQWLASLRLDAWQKAEAMQWPERRHEEWLRTDIRTFQINRYALPSNLASSVDHAEISAAHQLREGVETAGSIETLDSKILGARFLLGEPST